MATPRVGGIVLDFAKLRYRISLRKAIRWLSGQCSLPKLSCRMKSTEEDMCSFKLSRQRIMKAVLIKPVHAILAVVRKYSSLVA